MYTIGQISKRTNLKVPTIRYYEQMKLIDEPERSSGNQRRYSKAQLECLQFIKHGRELGLSIEALRELISLGNINSQACDRADEIAATHLKDIRIRIEKLKNLEDELSRIVSTCKGGKIEECYVMQSLSNHQLCRHEHS